jgi:TolB protein
MMRTLFTKFLAAFALLVPVFVQAQGGLLGEEPRLEIRDGVAAAIPVAVVPFNFEGAGLPPDTDIAGVISANLNRVGQFRALPRQDIVEYPARGEDVKFPTWRVLRQDFLVVGRVMDAEGGALRIEFELFDVAKQTRLLGLAVGARPGDLRGAAHQISDLIYEKITGVRGAFWTRIAYVTSTGSGRNRNFALMVADSDGYSPQTVVRSREPLLSPAWSPDGRRLAYVSFERGNSSIYIQEISTGQRQVVASYKGINGAPAFSPDGTRLALTLSMSGNPEIYLLDLASRRTTQITRHFSIDTEPQWMPDGQSLLFTSDRAGKPQIYQVPVAGGDVSRLTFQGEYNARVSVAYDGKRYAMAQGNGNVYRIAVLDRTLGGSGELRLISPGSLDESPSFAPNASMLLYATSEGPRGVLYAVSADGRVRQRLVLADGDVREPAWGPFRQRQ